MSEILAEHPGFDWVLDCPCGTRLSGESADEIVEVAHAHLAQEHPSLVNRYDREQILFMAVKFRR